MPKNASLSKVLTVAGRRLTVSKSTFSMELRRLSLLEAAQADPSIEGEGIEAAVRNGFHRMTYPSLVACTTGDVPTETECFDIVNDDLTAWLATAREYNPEWFPAPGQTVEEQEKKE